MTCKFPGCTRHPSDNGYCPAHYKYGKERKTNSKRSAKMTKDIAEVKKLYTIFLSNRTLCELQTPVCTKLATVVHHKKGRGSNLKKVETWMASCPACNGWVEQHTAEAYRLGLKEKRHTI